MLTSEQIQQAIPHTLLRADLSGLAGRVEGKVRDSFVQGGKRVLVTTDRVSAFDRVLGAIPFKGQVLNQLSAWWFEKTSDLVGNHVLAVPDPNVTIAHEADALQVEVIVRGFITGVTSTALWTLYEQGVDRPYGLELPPGLKKNDALPEPVITPTTKATGGAHDERLTCDEVVEHGLVEPELWAQVQRVALAIFKRGQEVAREAGLILVDTKYELGLDAQERLVVIDEIHTPDSSRYWYAERYERAISQAQDPEALDKEYVRRWLGDRGYRGEGAIPEIPAEVRCEAARRYIEAYERITGRAFEPESGDPVPRIRRNLSI